MKYFSLFSGIGAFEKAISNLNISYELVGYSEIDKDASKSYSAIHVEKFADYLIEWIVSKCDLEFDRQTEFNIVRMIVDCVELYEKESKRE